MKSIRRRKQTPTAFSRQLKIAQAKGLQGSAMLAEIADQLSAGLGEDFFSSLCAYLEKNLHFDEIFIGELSRLQAGRIQTVCVYSHGSLSDNFSYELKNTPCETVVGREICAYDRVQERFPTDRGLIAKGIQTYVGAPLFGSAGQPLGLMVLLFKRSIEDTALAEALLRIFATRAAAELERIQTEKVLRESESRFRSTLENIQMVAFTLDVQGNTTFCNDALLNLTGWALHQVKQKNWFELFVSDDSTLPSLFAENIHSGNIPKHYESEILTRQGSRRMMNWNNTILRDHEGSVVGMACIGQDITEQRQAEAYAQRQLRRLNALHRMDLVISSSFDLRFTLSVLVSQAIEQLAVHAAVILIYNPTLQVLEYGAGQGLLYSRIERVRLSPDQGHAGRALMERRTVRFPEKVGQKEAARFAELLDQEGFVAYFGAPLIAKGQIKGVLEIYHRKPLDPDQEWMDYLETLATQAAIAIESAELLEGLQRINTDLVQAYDATLESWVKALELRNHEPEGHSLQLAKRTIQLAQAMGVPDKSLIHMRRGALLHDIGEMIIPDRILLKPGSLDENEKALVRQHPIFAHQLLSPISYLHQALDIPYAHHERWDGSGYPRQLRQDEIPRPARIFSVIDVWDALLHDRPYRQSWEEAQVLQYIRSQSGQHFDPQVVEAFFDTLVQEPK